MANSILFLLNRRPCLKLRTTTIGNSTLPMVYCDPRILLFLLLLLRNLVCDKAIYTDSCLGMSLVPPSSVMTFDLVVNSVTTSEVC